MPVFVDPKTGEVYDNVPDDEAERAQKEFGLVSPELYEASKESFAKKAARSASANVGAPLEALSRVLPEGFRPPRGEEELSRQSPNARAFHEQAGAQTDEFFRKAALAGEASPGAALAGAVVPGAITGALSGGLGAGIAGGWGASPLVGGALGMLAESGTSGVAQEAVDAVTQKRDFSAKAALINGGIDLAFSALTFGLAHGASGARSAAGAADPSLPGRNWLTELDPGEVPEAIGGARRRARSAGSAGATNAPYRAPETPGSPPRRAGAADVAEDAANDVEPFADDLYDAAAKDIDDAMGGKGLDKEARFLADPHTARNLTDLGAMNVADQLDSVRTVLRDDVSLAAKNEDFARLAAEWTPEQVAAKRKWVDDTLGAEAEGLVAHIDDTRDAAADVRTGGNRAQPAPAVTADDLLDSYGDDVAARARAGLDLRQATRERLVEQGKAGAKQSSKEWRAVEAEIAAERLHARRPPAAAEAKAARRVGADAIDAGGFDSAIQKSVRTGLDRIRRADGAEQVIAIDALKRDVGKLVGDIKKSRTIDDATKAERTGKLTSFYETLQQGLEDEAKFGRVGTLQKATNEPLSRLIEPLSRIESKLSERLGDTFGQTGQKAINRETKASAVAQMLRAKPVERREFIRTLDEALSGIDDVMAARQAHGITHLDDLKAARRGLEEMRSEFKFSAVLQAAERRASEATPGWGAMAAEAAVDFAGNRIPIAGGMMAKQGKSFLQSLANAAEMPKAGTPLGDALAQRLKAYSRNPDLADAGVSRTLPTWLQGALRGKGGQVAGVAGVVGAGALLAPGEAGAAEMGASEMGAQLLPEQRQARDGFGQQLSVMPPDQQQAAIRTAEAFARIQKRTEQRVAGSVSDLFSLAWNPKAKPQHRSPEARQLDQRARSLDVPRHLARFMGERDDPVAAFGDKRKLIQSVSQDPAELARTMAAHLGDLPTQQPEIFASMVGQTMATVQRLAETMPGNAGQSALDPGGYPPSFEEISEWAARWVGALYPLDTLDDLASNDHQPEQMEEVQGLHPDTFVMFQTQAMRQIHELSRKRGPIPLEALEQIDGALGLDGAGEPILSSAMASLLEQAAAKDAERLQAESQKLPPPPGPMPSAGPSRLASSSLASLHPQ